MKLFSKRAQSTAEYAILIALVIGAAVAMQVYVKRGMQGGLKFATDKLKGTPTVEPGFERMAVTGQYEPYYLQSQTDTTRENVKSIDETKEGGLVERKVGEIGDGEKTTRAYISKQAATSEKD